MSLGLLLWRLGIGAFLIHHLQLIHHLRLWSGRLDGAFFGRLYARDGVVFEECLQTDRVLDVIDRVVQTFSENSIFS